MVLGSYLLGLLPKLGRYLPTHLTNGNDLLYGAARADSYLAAAVITVPAILLCFALSLSIFKKKLL